MKLTQAHKAAAFEWLRYLAERHGVIDDRDREQADIALRVWNDAEQRAERAEQRRREIDDEAFHYSEQVEYWRDRADRADAENKRLREELKSEQGRTAWWRNRAATNLERTDAPHTPEQTAEYGEITESDGDMGLPGMWEAADFVGGPDDTPEQEHEDALAALDNQLMEAVMALNDSGNPNLAGSVQEARRQLAASDTQVHGDALDALINRVVPALDEMSDLEETQYPAEAALYHDRNRIRQELRDELRAASSVPYVPEEVRRLPEKMRADIAHLRKGSYSSLSNSDAIRIAATEHWADELERTLASAPADGNFITRKEAFQAWSALDKQDLTKAKSILAEALDATAPTDGR